MRNSWALELGAPCSEKKAGFRRVHLLRAFYFLAGLLPATLTDLILLAALAGLLSALAALLAAALSGLLLLLARLALATLLTATLVLIIRHGVLPLLRRTARGMVRSGHTLS